MKKCSYLKNYQFKKGQPSWNKGKHFSEEVKDRMRLAKKGKTNLKLSETRKRMFKEGKLIHPKSMLGRHHTQEAIKKIRLGNTGKYGKHTKEGLERKRKFMRERIVTYKTKEKISKTRIEKGLSKMQNNPRWLGGLSFEPYSPEFNEALKEQIRQRDNFTCRLCGLIQNGHKHSVHHIDYNKKNNDPKNLITLCFICHNKTNNNRDYWLNHFELVYRNEDVKLFKVI